MKKLLFTMTMIAAFGVANAQTEEGGWFVGASSNLGFSSTSIDGVSDNANNFNLNGRAGYFFMENLTGGLAIGFSNTKQGDNKLTNTLIGPFVRYYVNGTFFVGAGYSAEKRKTEFTGGDTEATGGNLNFEAGYPIFIGDGGNVAIEPALNYTIGTGDFDNTSTFGLAVGFNLYF
ncbi:MAG: outer membrane beta-barrel protein [Cyclobacteriaceae bacterium]